MENYKSESKKQIQKIQQNNTKSINGCSNIGSALSFKVENKKRGVSDILTNPRSIAFLSAIQKADEMSEDDFEIMDMTYEHIEKQQEELVGAENVDQLLYTLSKCYIPGCKVHTIYKDFIHYGDFVDNGYNERPISSMPERLKKGYKVYDNHPGCLSVEIYEKHICVIDYSGKSTIVEE